MTEHHVIQWLLVIVWLGADFLSASTGTWKQAGWLLVQAVAIAFWCHNFGCSTLATTLILIANMVIVSVLRFALARRRKA